jgi:hypothetical protein
MSIMTAYPRAEVGKRCADRDKSHRDDSEEVEAEPEHVEIERTVEIERIMDGAGAMHERQRRRKRYHRQFWEGSITIMCGSDIR